jgi:hypothetical protein
MAWVFVKDEGGVDVSSAAAKTLRFGRPISSSLAVDLPVSGFGLLDMASWLGAGPFFELELCRL